MGVFGPVTRFTNRTTDDMLLIMREDGGHVVYYMKVIPAGGHVDVWYRKGMPRFGQKFIFLVQPETRSGVPGKEIFPFTVFDFAKIDICYKLVNGSAVCEYEDGAFIDFDFMKSNIFLRIGLVKKLHGVFSAFGNCYCATSAPALALPVVAGSSLDHNSEMESVIIGSAESTHSPEIQVAVN